MVWDSFPATAGRGVGELALGWQVRDCLAASVGPVGQLVTPLVSQQDGGRCSSPPQSPARRPVPSQQRAN